MKTRFYYSLILTSLFFSVYEKANAQAPSCQWAKRMGALDFDQSTGVTTDDFGNVYTTGWFRDIVDFDQGPGTSYLTSAGYDDIFITKSDNSGNFIWAKSLGGLSYDHSYSIAVDANGNVYTTGYFNGTADFNPGAGTYNLTSAGMQDIFISKLDSAGNFMWVQQFGSTDDDQSYSIKADSSGNVYTTGIFEATVDFDPDPGVTFNLTSAGIHDIFILKLNGGGNLIWAKSLRGTDNNLSYAITIDDSGNVFTTGYFLGAIDFDPDTTGIFSLASAGANDIFISKLDSSGHFKWAKRIGGVDDDFCKAIVTDHSGNVYYSGDFWGTVDFDPGSGNFSFTSTLGGKDIFISKLDSAGNFIWAKKIGATGNEMTYSLTLDSLSNIYMTGVFIGIIDFDPDSSGIYNLTSSGDYDIFVAKLDSSADLLWAKSIGGTKFDQASSLSIDENSNVFISGYFASPTINTGTGTITNADLTGNSWDILIAKFGSCSSHFSVYPDTIPHNWFALNQASGVAPLTYTWSWGDGNTSTGASPSHTYSTPGYYNICLTINDADGCSSTYCDSTTYLNKGNNSIITISVLPVVPTGINEQNENSNGVNIYPNPATNHLTITLPKLSQKVNVAISDITGKTIYTNSDFSIEKLDVNTKDFSNGVYFVRVQTADFVETRKMIIAR